MLFQLQHNRFVRQFIPVIADTRKMFYQMLRHLLYAANQAAFVVCLMKVIFQHVAYLLPFLRAHLCMNPAICNNLHRPVREQQINQHAIVLFGIPYPQM